MPVRSLRFLLALAVLGSAVSASADIASDLSGKLVAVRGKSVIPYAAPDLAQAKYIALYFSAGWCPPCHQFTPDLVKFYQELKPQYPGFEIVFISGDHSTGEMEKYMAEMAMPWPAVRFSALPGSRNLTKFAGPGIPDLVLLNNNGDVLSDSFAGNEYFGPYKVMADLKQLLTSGAATKTSAATAKPATVAAASPGAPAKSHANSPSGTNWDDAFKKKSP